MTPNKVALHVLTELNSRYTPVPSSSCHRHSQSCFQAKLLDKDVGSLLSDHESRVVRVGSNVLRWYGQVGKLQVLDAVDTKSAIHDATLVLWCLLTD